MPVTESWIWKDEFWFPPNVTWRQVEDEGNYPKFFDLLYCFPLAIVIMLIRYLVEKLLFIPLALSCGIKRKNYEHNDILEEAYRKGCQPASKIQELALAVQWSEKKVQSWFRKRSRTRKTSKQQKFIESGWRCTFYVILVLYGYNCLRDTDYLWNVKECWTNRETFVIPTTVRWYYIVELAFYVSLMISQFSDVQRKDFWQMMIHHVVTITLVIVSWTLNCVRIGSVILICHDIADVPLEAAKLFGYLKMQKLCDVTFVVFLLVWIISRLIIFPFVLLKSAWYDSPLLLGPIPIYICNALCWILFALHVMWTWMILRIVKTFIVGKPKDVRSDSEEDSTELSDSSEKKVN